MLATFDCSLGSEQALAQPPYDQPQTAEGWAWTQIKDGKPADFNAHCNSKLDAHTGSPGWDETCRLLSAKFVVDVLTGAPWSKDVPFPGVHIVGARIAGDINLQRAALERPLIIEACRIDANVILDEVRTKTAIEFVNSSIAGTFSAEQLRSELSLVLKKSEFKTGLSLADSKIDGYVDMANVTVDGDFKASSMLVGTMLFMGAEDNGQPKFKNIYLYGAKIGGQLSLAGANVGGDLNATAIQVGDTLSLRSTSKASVSRFKNVVLIKAKITGNLDLSGATVEQRLELDSIQIDGSLLLRSPTFNKDVLVANFNDINLTNAKIAGQISMNESVLSGNVTADSLRVGNAIFLRNADASGTIEFTFGQVGGNVDLRGATLKHLDLSGTAIAGDLRLGLGNTNKPTAFRDKFGIAGDLKLHNARATDLIDTKESWPEAGHLHLDGFAFVHLGGIEDNSGSEMRGRGMEWWDEWARRDPIYTPMPYEQLAAALMASGNRAAADDIRFLGRVRQHELETSCLRSFASGALQYVAGFGIGTYAFRVLFWVIGIAGAGAIYLWACVPEAKKEGSLWCFGASLARLLPIVEINKDFADFFEKPHRHKMTGFQNTVFSIIGILGWVLGAILIAAISGMLQDH